MILKICLIIMIFVVIVGLLLSPTQFGVFDKAVLSENDRNRETVYQQMLADRTSKELRSRVRGEYKADVGDVYQNKRTQLDYNIQNSRKSGEVIIKDRELQGLNPDGTVSDKPYESDTKKRSTAISKWAKENILR